MKKKLKYEQQQIINMSDHREIGNLQKLFFFDPVSPGSCFWLPHGALIYNKLIEFMRNQYYKREYLEVISPNIYNCDLWKCSGHYDHYKDNMFLFDIESQEFGLKPMNCPGHCIMFKSQARSYRELPMRYADFGVLHRNEFSGALSGLSRVRRFQQDDAHIFCAQNQIEHEISNVLNFIKDVYCVFGFKLELAFSSRPSNSIGSDDVWNSAEHMILNALKLFCEEQFYVKKGDGAFYGPKIDISIVDSSQRKHQCATIQLDFNLPERFDLKYIDEHGEYQRPVMIHRAVFGSVERFFAMFAEHCQGRWPFWVSPRQVLIVPISEKHHDYAQNCLNKLKFENNLKLNVEIDLSSKKMERKIRDGQLIHFNYIIVVGNKEIEHDSINVRSYDGKILGEMKIIDFINICKNRIENLD